jgi:hypothetical protein
MVRVVSLQKRRKEKEGKKGKEKEEKKRKEKKRKIRKFYGITPPIKFIYNLTSPYHFYL